MQVNEQIFKELIKRGYSLNGKTRVWDVSDSKLWYLTPELSKGFVRLFEYEPYRKMVIDTELDLLRNNADYIAMKFGTKKFNLVGLGCGTGLKASELVKHFPKNVNIRYCPVDINSYFVEKASEVLKKDERVKDVRPFISDFRDFYSTIGELRTADYQKNMILLLGETLSHYDINDLLYSISEAMLPGDFLIIGNGYRVGERFVDLDKYKNPLFNKWFINIMKGLGFMEDEVKYGVRFANNRLEGYYKIIADKNVSSGKNKVDFKEDDEVVVAVQYKFYLEELKKFCKMYFSDVDVVADEKKEYCLLICKK